LIYVTSAYTVVGSGFHHKRLLTIESE